MDDVYIQYSSKLVLKIKTEEIYRKNMVCIVNTIQKSIGIAMGTQREMLELVAG